MSAQPTVHPPRRFVWLWAIAGVLLLMAATAAFCVWLATTTAGLRVTLRAVQNLLPLQLDAVAPRGSLWYGFGFDRFTLRVGSTEVDIRDLDAVPVRAATAPWRVDFAKLSASRVDVRVRPSAVPSTEPLRSIASPIAVSADQLRIGEFLLRTGPDTSVIELAARAIAAGISIGPEGYRISQGTLDVGRADAPLAATIEGTLDGARPFAISAKSSIKSTLQDKPVEARLSAGGSLIELMLAARVSGGGAGGSVDARIASFESPALQSLQLDLSGIDPRIWNAAAPSADLHLLADLKPEPGATFTLVGPVRIDNRTPGTVDTQRIPARQARAAIRWRERTLDAGDLVIDLVRGQARGTFGIEFAESPNWRAQAQLAGVDPSVIHSKLRPLTIDGSARARSDGKATEVNAELRNRDKLAATLALDLRATRELVQLNRALLTLGKGEAEARGEIELTGARSVRLNGRASALDPSLLVQGIDARLSGSFDIDGRLDPQPAGSVRFELADSAAFGRPLAGRGTATLSSSRELTLDLELAVRSARLVAKGGLGTPDLVLNVEINAPALDELGVAVKGALQAQAKLRGDWQAPAIAASLSARKLQAGAQSVEAASIQLDYSGGTDGTVLLSAEFAGHRSGTSPVLSLKSGQLNVRGKIGSHELRFDATNEESQPVRMLAHGGWSQRRWRGQIAELTAGRPFDLRLLEAAAFETDLATGRFGPARFEFAGALVEQVQLEAGAATLVTSGRFSNLRPTELAARSDQARTIPLIAREARDPLTLRGQWRLSLGNVADGELLIERSGGDLYTRAGADSAIALRELRLAARLRSNELRADASMRGDKAGDLVASIDATVQRDAKEGWRLAQTRPWLVEASGEVPAIRWLTALLPDRVQANLRMNGKLAGKVRIDGTPQSPRAAGNLTGEGLRVVWVDQGARLENGTLRAHVEGDTVILDELRFTGRPRATPANARAQRAAQTIAAQEPGFVAVTGRVKLPELTGVLQLQAERVPLLQRADRWIVASGGANIELSPKRVQLNGAVAADAGFVDFTIGTLPRLSSDVILLESRSAGLQPREPPVQIGFDFSIGLGEAFYLRGRGVEARLDGAVRLRGDGRGPIRATGTVTAQEASYEGYGQKLRVARGRLNFQGPVDNPALDILALRSGLPPEAGEIGVSITRTAVNPLVRLYSDPPLPDFQALSWLALGRPAEQGSDNVALASAALGLLGGSGEGIPTTLARQLGIDEISLRSGQIAGGASLLPRQSVAGSLRGDAVGTAGAGAEIITVGKRINDAITLSYEQALAGTGNVVRLSYQLSRRLSLIASSGTDSALDLVYSIAFD